MSCVSFVFRVLLNVGRNPQIWVALYFTLWRTLRFLLQLTDDTRSKPALGNPLEARMSNFVLKKKVFLDCVWNVITHAQKSDFVFRRNGRVHLNRQGRHFSRLLAAELWASTVVVLGAPCSEVVWRVLATHSIRQFPLHFPSRASPCAITFQLESNTSFGDEIFLPKQAHQLRFQILYLKKKMSKYQIAVHLWILLIILLYNSVTVLFVWEDIQLQLTLNT